MDEADDDDEVGGEPGNASMRRREMSMQPRGASNADKAAARKKNSSF